MSERLECEVLQKARYINTLTFILPKRNLQWEGFVEKVGFEPGVKE